ncbi:unnamed protein product [Linum trigynum]|uniref:Uncharacterized protein n=1 Tax=Linum trigynum TaxID=586398 RepID=A0AAV2D3A2_9ROSI
MAEGIYSRGRGSGDPWSGLSSSIRSSGSAGDRERRRRSAVTEIEVVRVVVIVVVGGLGSHDLSEALGGGFGGEVLGEWGEWRAEIRS